MNEHPGRLLLLSNSRNYGGGYLDHAEEWIRAFLGDHVRRALFVPYAGVTVGWDDYAANVAERFSRFDVNVTSIHKLKHAVKEIESADAIIVGGGNTFHLLKQLYDNGALWAIRERVLAGVPYIGWSAGSNVACPTIRTTNDMPIVEPSRLDAMRLVAFQINPHYTEESIPNHGGETRPQRIAEFTKANPGVTVVGLREGSALRVIHGVVTLLGPHPAKLFRDGEEAVEHAPGQINLHWEVAK
jgi:dipeptidase E